MNIADIVSWLFDGSWEGPVILLGLLVALACLVMMVVAFAQKRFNGGLGSLIGAALLVAFVTWLPKLQEVWPWDVALLPRIAAIAGSIAFVSGFAVVVGWLGREVATAMPVNSTTSSDEATDGSALDLSEQPVGNIAGAGGLRSEVHGH